MYAEDDEDGEMRYVVLFRGEENYASFSKSELSLCNNMIDSIFNNSANSKWRVIVGSLQQHPLQQKELTQDDMQAIIDVIPVGEGEM